MKTRSLLKSAQTLSKFFPPRNYPKPTTQKRASKTDSVLPSLNKPQKLERPYTTVQYENPVQTQAAAEKSSIIDDLISIARSKITTFSPIERPDLQAQMLGNFNKAQVKLPFVNDAMDLVLLRKARNEPTPAAKKMLQNMDLQRTKPYYGMFLNKSGAGKTTAICDIAHDHYVIFFHCVYQQAGGNVTGVDARRDPNFSVMCYDVESNLKTASPWENNQLVKDRFTLELVARLLLLRELIQRYGAETITPQQFISCQLNGGSKIIAEIVMELKEYFANKKCSDVFLLTLKNELELDPRIGRLVIAFDEANVAMEYLEGVFLSTNVHKRGIFTPIIKTAARCEFSCIISGTALRQASKESVQSDIGKLGELDIVMNEFVPEDDPQAFLEKYLDLTDCTISPSDISLMKGCYRLVGNVISRFLPQVLHLHPGASKSEQMHLAIRLSADEQIIRMRQILQEAYSQNPTGMLTLLKKLVADHTFMQRINPSPSMDVVHLGLCFIKTVPGKELVYRVSEQTAMTAIVQFLMQQTGETPPSMVLDERANRLREVIAELGASATPKGQYFERLALAQLMHNKFEDTTISNIIRKWSADVILPKWTERIKFPKIRLGASIDELNYSGDEIDLLKEFMNTKSEGVIGYFPTKFFRPDVWLGPLKVTKPTENGLSTETTWFFITVGCKLYGSESSANSIVQANTDSTNPMYAFKKTGSKKGFPKGTWSKYHKLFGDMFLSKPQTQTTATGMQGVDMQGNKHIYGGSLRFVITLPSTLHTGITVDGDDVIVKIGQDNMHTFFTGSAFYVLKDLYTRPPYAEDDNINLFLD